MNLLMSIALLCAAQRQQETQDPVERQVQRYKEQLTLTDDQVGKVREVLKKTNEELRGTLTDAQKKTMDEGGGRGNRGGAPGAPGSQGNTRGGFGGASWLPSTDELKTQLGLNEEQITKINEIRDAARQQIRTFFQNRGRGGNPGEEWTAFEAKSREDVTQKIRATLNDEQKPKLDEALKAVASREPATPGRRGPSVEDRVTRVMETLKVTDAKEADAIKSLVTKVVEAMDKVEAAQRDARTKVDETAKNAELSDEVVGTRIGELLKGIRDLEKELTAARRELTDVVSNRQELELLRRGILR